MLFEGGRGENRVCIIHKKIRLKIFKSGKLKYVILKMRQKKQHKCLFQN